MSKKLGEDGDYGVGNPPGTYDVWDDFSTVATGFKTEDEAQAYIESLYVHVREEETADPVAA
jgi:hypothetical protein